MPEERATIAKSYLVRLVLMCVVLTGFGLYCLYDWKIAYPRLQEIGLAYEDYKEKNPKDFPETWPAFAAENGWPTKVPSKPKTDSDIFTQLVMALIVLPLAALFLFKLAVELRRWVAADDAGLTATGGRAVAWDQIESLDETRWKAKGIAKVRYRDAAGRPQTILLDDFKSQREPVTQIFNRVKAVLNPGAAEEAAAAAAGEPAAGEAPPAEG